MNPIDYQKLWHKKMSLLRGLDSQFPMAMSLIVFAMKLLFRVTMIEEVRFEKNKEKK